MRHNKIRETSFVICGKLIYLSWSNLMVSVLQKLLNWLLWNICYKAETSPFICFSVCGQLNVFNLSRKKEKTQISMANMVHTFIYFLTLLTSPKAPKYSRIWSSEVSGLKPPTKTFLGGSLPWIALALLGSISFPSNLCSFNSNTYKNIPKTFLNML